MAGNSGAATTTDHYPGLTLHVEKVVEARAERAFAACVDPERLAEWWGPNGFTTLDVHLDVRRDGRYRITMQPPEGEAFHLRGMFREVDPPRRLRYSFEWEEPDPDDRETIVTLAFVDHPEGTMIVLDQGQFTTDERLALHTAGWTETLDRLARYLA